MSDQYPSSLYQKLSHLTYIPSYLINTFRSTLHHIYTTLFSRQSPSHTTAFPPFPTTLPPCRYRLDASTSSSITLPDGRALGYAEYGAPNGRAIIYLHGISGSRIEAAALEPEALSLGARIIAVDRPGIGVSSPHPGRTLLDHARDVGYLAETLGLREYGVLGISGGGPYALACALHLPCTSLKVISLVAGLGPPNIGYSGMNLPNYLGFSYIHTYAPWFVKWWARRQNMARLDVPDDVRLRRLYDDMVSSKPHEKDVEVYRHNWDDPQLFLSSTREAFKGGVEAFSQDGRVMCGDFGFRVEDIVERWEGSEAGLDVHLWYGKGDTNVPARHGEEIARRLGGAGGEEGEGHAAGGGRRGTVRVKLRVEDETHSSLEIKYKRECLKAIVDCL